MEFPHLLFKNAGLNATDIANLLKVSRITGYRWLRGGAGVNVFLQDRVAEIVPALTKAVKTGALPSADVSELPPEKRASRIRSILRKNR